MSEGKRVTPEPNVATSREPYQKHTPLPLFVLSSPPSSQCLLLLKTAPAKWLALSSWTTLFCLNLALNLLRDRETARKQRKEVSEV